MIRTVVTRGYGSGGSIALVVRRGYASGEAPPASEVHAGGVFRRPALDCGRVFRRPPLDSGRVFRGAT